MLLSNSRFLSLFVLISQSYTLLGAAAPARIALPGHVPGALSNLYPVGRLAPGTNLSLALGLPLRNPLELQAFLQQLQDPRSTNFHRYLSPGQFTDRFGPTEQQYESLAKFAEGSGLKVVGRHSNRVVLDVDGSVSDIERAFQITLRLYPHPSERRNFFAPDTEPTVPAALAVADIWGLSDFAPPTPLVRPVAPPQVAPVPLGGSAPGGSLQGTDFRNAYAPGALLRGVGQTAAVVEFDGYYPADITTYESNCGYTNVPLQNVLLDGVSGAPGYSGQANAVAEVSLDIELLVAMAPGLSKVMVYEGSNPYDVFNRVVTDNLARQVSCSWAWNTGPTHNWGHPGTKTLDSQLQQMAAQGQAFFQAAGDSDAYTGTQALSTSAGPTPVDSIYVTSVGGTTLTMNGSGAAWSSETVWNWGNNTGTGGGISPNYTIPSWQAGVDMSANAGSTSQRNIPDVALTADQVYVVYSNGLAAVFGGTSCAAPLWTGFSALVNQQAAAAGAAPAGFLNPALYTLAAGTNYGACFHDITTGNNIGSHTPGLFNAVAGYDLCTGLGTPNGTNLINALAPWPCVLAQPASQNVAAGSTVTFNVTIGGQPPFGYSWRFNGTNLPAGPGISGTTSDPLTLLSVTTANAGNYSVVVTNAYGSVTSALATLSIVVPPSITAQPTNQTVAPGQTVSFSSTASGALPLVYQWRKNGLNLGNAGNLSGAASNVLTCTSAVLTNAGDYTLVVTNIYGAVTSSVAVLTVIEAPVISVAPIAQLVQCGSNAAFSVTATGTAPLRYLWTLDGVALAGATGTSLALTDVHLPNHLVVVAVTNLYGSATSSVPLSVQDTLMPTITLLGNNPFFVELGGAFADPGATATDLCAGALPVSSAGVVNTGVVGTNTLTYSANDGNGNIASAARRVIVRDTTPPTITWSFTNLSLVAGANCAASMPDVTGTNFILATDLSGALTISQAPPTNTALSLGTNVVVIAVADSSANVSYSTNEIVVVDQAPPLFTQEPENQTNSAGGTVSFSASASACTPLAWQWFFNGAMLDGQTNLALVLSNLTLPAAGDYFVVASSSAGSSTSAVATLTVDLLASAVTLLSSENPAGFDQPVIISAAILPATAGGSIQFLSNGVEVEIQPVVAGLAISTNLALLPRGTNLLTALYSGDANTLPSTNSLLQIVTNHPPLAATVEFTRAAGEVLDIALTNLSAYWSDADGDALSLVAVGISTNGVVLTNTAGLIEYSNAQNVADQFVCTIADAWGGTNFQTVTITVLLPGFTSIVANSDGTVSLNLSGAPGATYVLESTSELFPAAWAPLATNTLSADGVWHFMDPGSANLPQRFYRLTLAP